MRTNLVVIKTFRLAQGLPTWGTFKVSNRRKTYLDLIYFQIYRIYSSITRTRNFLIENWYKFLFTFSQLRPRIVSDRYCWKSAATTIHSLTTYDTLVNQTTSRNTIPKWNLQFIQVMHRPTTHGILEKCSRLPNIMKAKKRNKSKTCWWKNYNAHP